MLVNEVTVVLWTQVNYLVGLTLLPLFGLAALGFFDDYTKVTRQTSDGVRAKVKLTFQLALGIFIATYLYWIPDTRPLITDIMVPFEKDAVLRGAGAVGIGLTVLTIMGSSNAVNLTDGLDGLAIGCTLIVAAVFLILTYVAGHVKMASYLHVPYIAGAGELTVVCGAICGAALGVLVFNCFPAVWFLGATGSTALGGGRGMDPRRGPFGPAGGGRPNPPIGWRRRAERFDESGGGPGGWGPACIEAVETAVRLLPVIGNRVHLQGDARWVLLLWREATVQYGGMGGRRGHRVLAAGRVSPSRTQPDGSRNARVSLRTA